MEWYSILIIVVLVILLLASVSVISNKNDELEDSRHVNKFYQKEIANKDDEISKLYREKLYNYTFNELPNEFKISCLKSENKELKELNTKLKQEVESYNTPCRCDEPIENLFECECGNVEFVQLKETSYNGIKGEIPYVEIEIQCQKCGRLHTIKRKDWATEYPKDNLIK